VLTCPETGPCMPFIRRIHAAHPDGPACSRSKSFVLTILSVRRLIALHSWLPLPAVTLACGSWSPLRCGSSGRSLAVPPLPSASIYVSVITTVTGFTYRELAPHKITPMPGVHKRFEADGLPFCCAPRQAAAQAEQWPPIPGGHCGGCGVRVI
jgi:hypothetical protein